MRLELLEVVYEGGDILDVALAHQRRLLRTKLEDRFATVDLRRTGASARRTALIRLAEMPPAHVLVRGLHRIDEVASAFPRSRLWLDYLGRCRALYPDELGLWAFRIARTFCYSMEADAAVRRAGCGRVSLHRGPFLPSMPLPPPTGRLVVGVLDNWDGAREVLVRLKKLQKAREDWDCDLVSTVQMGGVCRVEHAFEVGEESNLLIGPVDSADYGGPHEALLLAMSLGRALCTAGTPALWGASTSMDKKLLLAQKHEPGTYATSLRAYKANRAKYDSALSGLQGDPAAVPQELLRSL